MATQIGSSLGTIASGSGRLVVRTAGSGFLYAVVNNAGVIRVYASPDNGSTWIQQDSAHAPSTVSSSDAISAAIDSSDVIHITYQFSGASVGIEYITFNASTNLFGTAASTGISGYTTVNCVAIAVDSNNVPHVISAGPTAGGNAGKYANKVGGSWNSSVLITTTNGINFADILIDNNNIPEIAICEAITAIKALIGNVNNTTSFTAQSLDTTFTSTSVSIAMDSSNNTWISYEDVTNGAVTLIEHLSGNAWSTWQASVNDSNNGKTTSLAVNGTNVYVFYEPTGTSEIAYDMYNGSAWLGQTVIETGTHHNPKTKWSQYSNNQGSIELDFLFDNGTGIFFDSLTFPPTTTKVYFVGNRAQQPVNANGITTF